VKYTFVRAHRQAFRVTAMCRVLQVSRSGYYDWCRRKPSRRRRSNDRLLQRIQGVHRAARGNYGAVKTWQALTAAGEACGRHRVARLRREHGIEAQRMRRFRSGYAGRTSEPAAPNLIQRRFQAERPDQAWVGDVTFVATREGWLHLAALLDLHSRRIVGWAMSERINQPLVAQALLMAIEHRQPPPGLIHHTDQGVIYASAAYRAILARHGMVPSMSRKGDCYDNAVIESFFSNLKNELTWHRAFTTRDEARAAIFDYIEVFYNRQRLHQTLGYIRPACYEEQAAAP
jgi:transposase InsO family protein